MSTSANYLELKISTTKTLDAKVYDADLVARIDSTERKFPIKIYIIEVKVTPPPIADEVYKI